MKKDLKIFLEHIIESISEIEEDIKGISKRIFLKDRKTQDAVIRRIAIIGEAANNLSFGFKRKYPEIDWREIIGMRNILIHEYFGVDLDIIWKTIKKDLPNLEKKILKILEQ